MSEVLYVDWKMRTGYSGAEHDGTVEIELSELEGKTPEEQEEIIGKVIVEDAMQYVDVFPTRKYREGDESK